MVMLSTDRGTFRTEGIVMPANDTAVAPVRVPEQLFEPVSTRRAFESVIGQIVDRIRAGELREGSILPGERALAARLQVSRPTVRLALEVLADAGVLEIRSGRSGGARVASIWIPEGLADGARAEPRADEIFKMLEARRAVEPQVAQLAAMRATEEDFQELRRCIELEASQLGNWSRMVQADLLFHRQMWRMARNEDLEAMLVMLIDKLTIGLDMAMRTTTDQTEAVAIHERTLEALIRGDMGRIVAVMDEHMAYLEEICEDVLGRKRLREMPTFLRASGRGDSA
jgi:GntR family transcriptional regulator, transcriptional repressor for pyruvate dehydrogenase complex